MADLHCARCGREAQALDQPPPLPQKLADEVFARVCSACWDEWEKMEVMVINELRLNFMDPQAIPILHRHLREFCGLDPPASAS
jgi:Fe-S cluster biosynthesis and repair protein YggX